MFTARYTQYTLYDKAIIQNACVLDFNYDLEMH